MEARKRRVYGGAAYQYGSAAPKRVYSPRPRPKQKPRVRVKKAPPQVYRRVQVSYKNHPVTQARRQHTLKVVMTVAAVFVMLFAVVLVKSYSSSINLENIAIQKDIDRLNDDIAKLNIEITARCDIKNIASIAEHRLGMSFPENRNIRYVEVSGDQVLPEAETANLTDSDS